MHKAQMTHALRGITNIDVYIDLPISPIYSYIFFDTQTFVRGCVSGLPAGDPETCPLDDWRPLLSEWELKNLAAYETKLLGAVCREPILLTGWYVHISLHIPKQIHESTYIYMDLFGNHVSPQLYPSLYIYTHVFLIFMKNYVCIYIHITKNI